MSWCVNEGPSFNNKLGAYPKLNGFYQRFQLEQDDPRMTPGKTQPKLPRKQVKYSDTIFPGQPEPIYRGFSNIKNKATKNIKKSKKKLKRRVLKSELI